MKISEMITDRYKLRIPPTVYYELLADIQEVEEDQEPTTKNNLGVEKIIDEIEKEFEKVDIPIMDKLTLFAKVQNSLYKCAELRKSKIPTGSITENCIACKYDEIEESDGEHCKKCLAGDSQFELDKEFVQPINGLDDFIEFGQKAFGVELTIKKSDNPDTYAKLFGTTKNDLGVERQIKEICISYPKSDLKEHDGQPYYSVKYIENGEEYEGYGTYKIEVFMEYLKNYFMPSITPQLRKGHWISTETKGVRYAFWCRYKCSLCGELSDYKNFCPNCGSYNGGASNGNE